MKIAENSSHRVVITGIGAVSPLGLSMDATWDAMIQGKSGIDYITLFDASKHATKFAGEVKEFNPTDFVNRKEARRMDRFSQFAVAAARQALEDANFQITEENQGRIGVLVGSGIGGLITLSQQISTMEEKGPDKVSPFLVPMMIGDSASGQVSIAVGAKGPNLCATSACSSGADALGLAYELIKRGDAQAMLAGGAEAIVTPIGIAGFNACKAISTRNDDPAHASRPFDIDRDGFVIGEGAAILVLEELQSALERGAPILAEFISYGASGDGHHMTQPSENGEGAARAINIALKKAGITINDIDYINAHGTSTPMNDRTETKAIKAVFGEQSYKVPISSTKSMVGHLIGAAGAIEAAVCTRVVQNDIIPPTINLKEADPACDLDYVPNVARKAKVTIALSNSFGFGGHNSSLLFAKYNGAGE